MIPVETDTSERTAVRRSGRRISAFAAAVVQAIALLFLLAPLAEALAQEVDLGGQVRPRFELRDPVAGEAEAFTSMRVRADLDARLDRQVRAFVQFQDVRIWGEETSTLGDFRADAFDLHQGFLQVGDGEGGLLWARAGRQEVVYGGQRLVGAVGWTQQARSFDGLRLATDLGGLQVDLFGFQLSDAHAASVESDAEFAGAYGVWSPAEGHSLDLYGLFRRVRAEAATDEGTFGARYVGGQAGWSYRVEGSIQAGTRAGSDLGAAMFGARLGRAFAGGDARVTLWYDWLSGDADPTDDEIGVFHTLFATNHKFYGFADLFLNIPVHTGGRGLQDAAVKLSASAGERVSLGADFHAFRVAESGGGVDARLGEELDLTATYRYADGLTGQGGFSYVIQGPGLADLERLEEDMIFFYVMVDARF